jgi:hypothetical protein
MSKNEIPRYTKREWRFQVTQAGTRTLVSSSGHNDVLLWGYSAGKVLSWTSDCAGIGSRVLPSEWNSQLKWAALDR